MNSLRPGTSSNKRSHVLHYLLVLLGTIAVTLLEVKVPLLTNGLRTAPFTLIPLIAALYGGYWSGIFAILVCSVAVDYTMPPTGFSLTGSVLFRVFEYVLIASTMFVLAWRSRKLYATNVSLRTTTETLYNITEDLKIEAQGNIEELKKLNTVNKKLVSLVDEFVQDDEYWNRKLTTRVPPTEKVIKKATR